MGALESCCAVGVETWRYGGIEFWRRAAGVAIWRSGAVSVAIWRYGGLEASYRRRDVEV